MKARYHGQILCRLDRVVASCWNLYRLARNGTEPLVPGGHRKNGGSYTLKASAAEFAHCRACSRNESCQ